jgi:hypothetical protein
LFYSQRIPKELGAFHWVIDGKVPVQRPQFITWVALKDQFGFHYDKMFKFKQVFRTTLRMVTTQYPAAKFTMDDRGMTLMCSLPPVAKRLVGPMTLPENLRRGQGTS